MSIGRKFRRLTRVIRRLEENGWDIHDVKALEGQSMCAGGSMHAAIDCYKSDPEDSTPPGPQSLGLSDHPVHMQPMAVQTDRTGTTVELQVTIESSEGEPTERSQTATDLPLHRNQSRLTRLYHMHETFGEIAESIEEDVSAETIRRYMIEHGIHEPGAKTPEPQEQPSILADGMGLSRSVDEIIEAVSRANTVYDVQRRLDLDREQTTSVLQELDLIDLVTGRITEANHRDERDREIRQRLMLRAGT